MSTRTKLGATGLQHNRNVRRQVLYHARQFESGIGAELAVPRELHVGDDAEDVVAISLHQLGGFFEVRAEQNLGPCLHAHELVRYVDSFLNHAPRLLDQLGVNDGQERRVIPNVVFDYEEHGNAHSACVVEHVVLVFDVLNNRDQDARGSLPEEDTVDIGDRIARNEILDLAIVVSEDNDRRIESRFANLSGEIGSVGVADGEVGNDQIESGIRLHQIKRFRAARHVRDTGNLSQVQFERFIDEEFVEASIFAQDEGVVETRDQQNVLDAKRHQVLETFEAFFGIENRLGDGADNHGLMTAHDTSAR